MTSLPFKLQIDPTPTQFLFTVRGPMAAADLEGGRLAHNMAAGTDQAVAAARSFSDLSHAVWVPTEDAESGAGELLIIDYWNNPDGIGRFFADPQVQQGGAAVYQSRESAVWQPTAGLPRFNLPAPAGKDERYLGFVRGTVAGRAAAEKALTEIMRKAVNTSRAKGLMAREWYFRASGPGEPASTEIIGLDTWFDADGMNAVYADPAEMAGFDSLFTAEPDAMTWKKPAGHWVEW